MVWLDTGTYDGLLEDSNFIETVQKWQSFYVAFLEGIAFNFEYISKEKLFELVEPLKKTDYDKYLVKLVKSSK